jgi:uncharacterized protein
MKRIVIPGGTGYLGRALAELLVARGDDVVMLSRSGKSRVDGCRVVEWDGRTVGAWARELDGADAIVHLSGQRVDTRATKRNVDNLISSRVEPVKAVGQAAKECANPPKVWIQSGSLAIFGETGDQIVDEQTTPTGIGPREMVTVCLAWEAAYRQASAIVPRRVLLRMGIGLGGVNDPATAKLAQLVKLGLGGKIGSGKQWVSWVALNDILRVMIQSIDDPTMAGTFHVSSPNPVTNQEMMRTYRRLLGRKFGFASPALLVKFGAPILGSSASLALTVRRVMPTNLLSHGFTFETPNFEEAVKQALRACNLLKD